MKQMAATSQIHMDIMNDGVPTVPAEVNTLLISRGWVPRSRVGEEGYYTNQNYGSCPYSWAEAVAIEHAKTMIFMKEPYEQLV